MMTVTAVCRFYQWKCSKNTRLEKQTLLLASEGATIHFTPLTTAGCVIAWVLLLSHSSRSHWGSCHQPCMSLPAFSRCVGADGMAASQAQLQHQICFLSVMPNYGKETNAVYMLSLLGQRLDEMKWEMSHSLSSTPTYDLTVAVTVS